jgi:ribosomal protein L11 methyltransferase
MAFYEAPGLRHPLVRASRGYDLVFANILARPLTRLAPSLARAVATDGTLVLSGLIPRDVPGVLAAYAGQGFRLRRRRLIEGWATLELRRGGAAPRPR